jgi:hypothetical protein
MEPVYGGKDERAARRIEEPASCPNHAKLTLIQEFVVGTLHPESSIDTPINNL